MSNEEKLMIIKILKKEWFIWKFWKKGGVVEKRGEEETKSMPHAPVMVISKYAQFWGIFKILAELHCKRFDEIFYKPKQSYEEFSLKI